MWGTSHEDDLHYTEVKAVEIMLRHHGELQRRLPIAQLIERTPVQCDAARRRFLHAVKTFEEHTLAAAVWSDDPEEFLRVQMKIQPLKNLLVSDEEFYRLSQYLHITALRIHRCVSP